MRSLVSLHLLPGHSGQLLGQLPPPGRHLHRRGQQNKVQDQLSNQTLAVHLQQRLVGERRTISALFPSVKARPLQYVKTDPATLSLGDHLSVDE